MKSLPWIDLHKINMCILTTFRCCCCCSEFAKVRRATGKSVPVKLSVNEMICTYQPFYWNLWTNLLYSFLLLHVIYPFSHLPFHLFVKISGNLSFMSQSILRPDDNNILKKKKRFVEFSSIKWFSFSSVLLNSLKIENIKYDKKGKQTGLIRNENKRK